MPAMQSFSVNDRETTPVSHTFTPTDGGVSTGVAVLEEAAAVPKGNRQVSLSRRKSTTASKARMLFKNPVLVTETINGVNRYVVDRSSYVDVTFTFPADSTQQERANTIGMFANMLAPGVTLVNDFLVKGEGVW